MKDHQYLQGMRPLAQLLLFSLLTLPAASCRDNAPLIPASISPLPGETIDGELDWPEGETAPFPTGHWNWLCTPSALLADPSGSGPMKVTLTTRLDGGTIKWKWRFPQFPVEKFPVDLGTMTLVPQDPEIWHHMEYQPGQDGPQGALPLPVIGVDSPNYPHLLALLQELTLPWFNQVVAHWPSRPIPIRVGSMTSGKVDLSACLKEAVDIWNRDPQDPWFQIDEGASWGIRLVHFPDISLSPPMEARITRLDDSSSPLRINIAVGNNYERLRYPKYVVRGFVHELAHTLFLWGHSQDRDHCLWATAPPIVDQPSEDERKAARLWHGLPVGLDLSGYH